MFAHISELAHRSRMFHASKAFFTAILRTKAIHFVENPQLEDEVHVRYRQRVSRHPHRQAA